MIAIDHTVPTAPAKHALSRAKPPEDRFGIVHEFVLSGHVVVLTTGEYEDGSLAEIFLAVDKEGSTMSGILDAFATAISLGIQYGIPLAVLVDKFTGSRFEPLGFVSHEQIREVSSILDYCFRWLWLHYGEAS